jgi:hypothetical protein
MGQSSLLADLAAMPNSRRFLPTFFGAGEERAIGLELPPGILPATDLPGEQDRPATDENG